MAEACNWQFVLFYCFTAIAKKCLLSPKSGGLPALPQWAAGPCALAADALLLQNAMPRAAVGLSPASHCLNSYLNSEGQEGTWKRIHKSYHVPLLQCGIA